MTEDDIFFEVKNGKFWIVEVHEKDDPQAWVFDNENGAIRELLKHISLENLDPDNIDPEEFSQTYNIQEVELSSKKYIMKGVSLLKIFMKGMMWKNQKQS